MTVIRGDVSWGFQAVQSTFCVAGDCLTVAPGPGRQCVMVWNSTNALVVQVWDLDDWADLLKAIKEGCRYPAGVTDPYGESVSLAPPCWTDPPVVFSYDEWTAFCDGVENGEFDFDKLCSPASRAGNSDAGRTAATGAVEPGPAPAPVAAALGSVVTGMNAAGYAAMNVPAGRDQPDESTPVGSLDAVATTGQPGPEPSEYAFDELADLIIENERMIIDGERLPDPWHLARWLLDHGYRRSPAPAWGSGPLVKLEFDRPDTSGAAVAAGWAPALPGVNEAGEVGPAHPRLGPTEPAAVDCMCRDCRALRGEVQV